MLMIELFAARKVALPFLKRSDRPAGSTLSAAPVSIKKLSLVFVIKSKEERGASLVGCGRSPTGSRVSLSVWLWKLARQQIARGTNKYQVGSEIVVVHALVKATARFSKSFVARF